MVRGHELRTTILRDHCPEPVRNPQSQMNPVLDSHFSDIRSLIQTVLFSILLSSVTLAEGTRLWQQSKYDEFEKGTAHGLAINSDGGLFLAPAVTPLYTT